MAESHALPKAVNTQGHPHTLKGVRYRRIGAGMKASTTFTTTA